MNEPDKLKDCIHSTRTRQTKRDKKKIILTDVINLSLNNQRQQIFFSSFHSVLNVSFKLYFVKQIPHSY